MTQDVDIETFAPSGDGLARIGRQMVAVPFTIPGERVRIQPGRVTKVGGAAIQDPPSVVEVLRPSPHRVTAPCPHFGPCGGCSWQHIAYPEQLRLKTALVDRLVRAAVPHAPRVLPMLPSTPLDRPWGYRHKVHFVFGRTGTMGHYTRGSRRVIPVRECPVHDPRGNDLAFRFRDAVAPAFPARPRGGSRIAQEDGGTRSTLEAIVIRAGANTPEIMATLVVTDDQDKKLRTATQRALASGAAPSSLHLNLHPRRDAFIFGRETRRLAGPERMREVVGGTSFLVSPTAFFQTNVHAAEILVRLVLEAVGADLEPVGADLKVGPYKTILDLYAGAGLFSLPLARRGHQVTAVEENRMAAADGEASLRLNRIAPDRCRFIARPVEAALRSVKAADVVVLDPPREGCSPLVVDEVFGRLRPRQAVYVSCNPDALARDLALIIAHGFTIASLQPVDMFPHTAHVETVAVLTCGSTL